jgi:methionyl-tRNA formyltransferase
MRVLLFCRKPAGAVALDHLLRLGADVAAVVTDPRDVPQPQGHPVLDLALKHGLPVVSHDWVRARAEGRRSDGPDLGGCDLLLCMFHQKRIPASVLGLARTASINVHPAPLPGFRGWGVYNVAILEGHSRWGATAHVMDADFDTGPIVAERSFAIDPAAETCVSLERRTAVACAELACEAIDLAWSGAPIAAREQGPGRTYTKRDVMAHRQVLPTDDEATVDRKIRAFWFPPYPGAQVAIAGGSYTLANPAVLAEASRALFSVGGAPGLPEPRTETNGPGATALP